MAVDLNQMAQEDDAYMQQASSERESQKSQQGAPEPGFLQKWVTGPIGRVSTQMVDGAVSAADQMYDTPEMRKARDVTAGAITGVTNIADAGQRVMKAGEQNFSDLLNPNFHAGTGQPAPYLAESSPVWDHAKQSILDFRDAVAVKDPTLADNLTQSMGQLALPFAGYSRALAGVHGFAKAFLAGGLTDATALLPHDARMADVFALGRHVEGKLGDALSTLAPDGSALNAYVNYLSDGAVKKPDGSYATDHSKESEAEGRFKNVLDGFGMNLISTPLMHGAAMVLKQGQGALRYAIENTSTKPAPRVEPTVGEN